MKITGIVLGVIVVLLGVFAVVASMQPAEFSVTRSAVINAPPEVVFAEVNDFHRWENWSPWAKLDPNAKSEFSGPASGEGAAMGWDGNHEVGTGKMTITESRAPSSIKMQLDFLKPMESTSYAEFSFNPQAGGTNVTWTMYGTNNFMGKAMSLIFDCEKMIGGYFEEGLTNLKNIAEAK